MKRKLTEEDRVVKKQKKNVPLSPTISKLVLELVAIHISKRERSTEWWKLWCYFLMHFKEWNLIIQNITLKETTKFELLAPTKWFKLYNKLVLWDIWERLEQQPHGEILTLVKGKYFAWKQENRPISLYIVHRLCKFECFPKRTLYTRISVKYMTSDRFIRCIYDPKIEKAWYFPKVYRGIWLDNEQASLAVKTIICKQKELALWRKQIIS
jgi:hypothetical protein